MSTVASGENGFALTAFLGSPLMTYTTPRDIPHPGRRRPVSARTGQSERSRAPRQVSGAATGGEKRHQLIVDEFGNVHRQNLGRA
jgi:hypothetical protein